MRYVQVASRLSADVVMKFQVRLAIVIICEEQEATTTCSTAYQNLPVIDNYLRVQTSGRTLFDEEIKGEYRESIVDAGSRTASHKRQLMVESNSVRLQSSSGMICVSPPAFNFAVVADKSSPNPQPQPGDDDTRALTEARLPRPLSFS